VERFDAYKIEPDNIHRDIQDSFVTANGRLQPKEKLTAKQTEYFLRKSFETLLMKFKSEDILYRLGQAVLFVAALYGVFKMIF